MKIILAKCYGSGFHPSSFQKELYVEKGWTRDRLYSDGKTEDGIKGFIKRMRSDPDIIDVVSKINENLPEDKQNYKILEVPDGIDYRVTDHSGFETAFFAYKNHIYDDSEIAFQVELNEMLARAQGEKADWKRMFFDDVSNDFEGVADKSYIRDALDTVGCNRDLRSDLGLAFLDDKDEEEEIGK